MGKLVRLKIKLITVQSSKNKKKKPINKLVLLSTNFRDQTIINLALSVKKATKTSKISKANKFSLL